MSACLDAFATTLGRLQRRLSCTRCRWNSRRSPCCFWLRGCPRAGKGWFRAYRTLTISDAISGSAPRPSGTGGLQTLCWRELDSNPRSPVSEDKARTTYRGRRSHDKADNCMPREQQRSAGAGAIRAETTERRAYYSPTLAASERSHGDSP
jgi:hypothetical protein